MNKVVDINKIKLTELFCANQFEKGLLSKECFKDLPNFDNILREMPCKQGIADFICFQNTDFLKKNSHKIFTLTEQIGKSFVPVMTSLLNKDCQDIQSLSVTTGYEKKRLNKIINVLMLEKVIKQNKSGYYSLRASWKKFDVKLWAFELKLQNWKRAIYQATQHQSFTDKVFTVFPVNKKSLILKNISSFKKLGVGCILHDYNNNSIEIINFPTEEELKRNSHYLFTLTETIIQKVCFN